MKNILILIVAAAIFLHFYPQPELESWFNEQKETALATFSDATDTKVRLKSDKIYQDLEPKLAQFNEEEKKFLKEITASRESVKAFYYQYCEKDKFSPKFHRTNQKLVCETIYKYTVYF